VAIFAAEIMAAAQELAFGANKLQAGKTAPMNGKIGVVFAKSSCHNCGAVSSSKPNHVILKLFCGKNKKKIAFPNFAQISLAFYPPLLFLCSAQFLLIF
jgi:hypothetical protein